MSESTKPNISKEIMQRLKSLDDLPHFPDALMRLEQALTENEDLPMQDITQLVAQDPRLVAGLIEMANSAKYMSGSKVTDLSDAVTMIGLKEMRLMAHLINYQTSFKRKPPFSDTHFLKHAFLSALIAQKLAQYLKLDAGEAFLAGLMRDIGVYLLATEDRDKYLEVIKETDFDISKLPQAENKMFGTYHALMSARLLQEWTFPNEVLMGVAFHHNPEKADPRFQPFAYLTFLAEHAVFRLGFDNGIADILEGDIENPPAKLIEALAFFDMSIETYDEISQLGLAEADKMGM
ncbi:HDOD domain-containing protein [Thiomicrorhabdus sp.]|uniref:HDOD domain-containing protein n=1 Tax=Thiomicrorhabdus sp. TaxID=2039724 RepID=UPI002AA851C4|nr:HDOD domain-containing protein [Thiomicrorhabdus sp.]